MNAKLGVLLVLAASCNTVTPSHSACDVACAKMDTICGTDSGCLAWCNRYHMGGYMKPWNTCVEHAETKEQVRACGIECK